MNTWAELIGMLLGGFLLGIAASLVVYRRALRIRFPAPTKFHEPDEHEEQCTELRWTKQTDECVCSREH